MKRKREEEIEKQAINYAGINYDCESESDSFYHGVQKYAYIAGAKWADENPQYNPYKTSIESIKECIERFRECGNDKDDLINNIYIKCKDAIEYANTFKD